MRAQRMAGARRDHGVPGKDERRDAPVVTAGIGIAPRADQQAAIELGHVKERHLVMLVVEVAAAALEQRVAPECAAVQKRHMAGVDAAFDRLQIVRFLQALADEAALRRDRHPLQRRRIGPQCRRAHVGPNHAAALDHRIGLEMDPLAHAGFVRFRRQFDTMAIDVVFPAVIGAAQAVRLVAAEPQRDTAMRAELLDHADASAGIAKGQQLFSEQLHSHRRAIRHRQFMVVKGRDPVAAKVVTHQGARPGADKFLVLFVAQHAKLSGISRIARRTPARSASSGGFRRQRSG